MITLNQEYCATMTHDHEAATTPVVRLLWQVSTLKPETPNREVLAPEEVAEGSVPRHKP